MGRSKVMDDSKGPFLLAKSFRVTKINSSIESNIKKLSSYQLFFFAR